jgi:glycyl-tRNA synthetase beta chain
MSSTKSLLVELFAEELPPKSLKKLGAAFAQTLFAGLKAQGLTSNHSAVTPYATPRRLAVHISAVLIEGTSRQVSVKLLPEQMAYSPSGEPTPALVSNLTKKHGFPSFEAAQSIGRFEVREDGGKRFVFHETLAAGLSLGRALQSALDDAIDHLPILKAMSYQLEDGWTSVNFVRPAHGLVALHGADVVPVQALGLTSGRNTQGHRFEAQMNPVVLQDADHYAQQLEQQGAVIAAFDHRRADIARQLQHAAAPLGLVPIDDDALLDEVTALVERPNVLLCQFELEFLAVPSECLILTMKANQKYFPLLDAKGALTNKFLVVSNIRPEDPSAIVQGNERVVRPRLADAKFFFDQDRKKTLVSRLPLLDKVVYHAKLGSQGERVERVRAIAREIVTMHWLDIAKLADPVDRAAELAKTDLLTDMVGEFPELQGIMGGYYALSDGESELVAFAIKDHYKPRFAGDALPRNQIGSIVALADKLETLAGLFSVGERPSGDKDPFALRRHALGVIRLLIERELPLDLPTLLNLAVRVVQDFNLESQWESQRNQRAFIEATKKELATGEPVEENFSPAPFKRRQYVPGASELLADFFYERLAANLREQGYSAHEIDAALSQRPQRLAEIPKRLEAVRAFASLPESASLAAANKRIGNILKKSDATPAAATAVNQSLLAEPAEKALASALHSAGSLADRFFNNGEYTASLRELAVLKAPVDAFFESVMVNVDDPALRANRVALLQSLHTAMNRVADLSKLAT